MFQITNWNEEKLKISQIFLNCKLLDKSLFVSLCWSVSYQISIIKFWWKKLRIFFFFYFLLFYCHGSLNQKTQKIENMKSPKSIDDKKKMFLKSKYSFIHSFSKFNPHHTHTHTLKFIPYKRISAKKKESIVILFFFGFWIEFTMWKFFFVSEKVFRKKNSKFKAMMVMNAKNRIWNSIQANFSDVFSFSGIFPQDFLFFVFSKFCH